MKDQDFSSGSSQVNIDGSKTERTHTDNADDEMEEEED